MSSNRAASLISAFLFLCIAALALYRLLAGFPISIGGVEVGQVATFLTLVISIGLALALLRRGREAS